MNYLPKYIRIFFIALFICFMIVVFNNPTVFANDSENNETNQLPQESVYEEDVNLSASSESGKVGEEVTVIISIENAQGTGGGEFELSYDPDIVEPVEIDEGAFFSDVNNLFESNLEFTDSRIKVIWVTPELDTADSGVLCTIVFNLKKAGNSPLDFHEVVFAPEGIELDTAVSGNIESKDDPDKVGKEEAIKAADRAIRWLPRPENIRFLPPNIQSDIAAAQALVDIAKNEFGATDDDFADLAKLQAVKDKVEKRKAIFAARDAIDLIPPPGTITEEDREVIEEARRLVKIAIEEYGATDFDLCWRLRKLLISEYRLGDKLPPDPDDPDDPLPPTGAMVTTIVSGFLLTGAGLFFLVKRKGRFNF